MLSGPVAMLSLPYPGVRLVIALCAFLSAALVCHRQLYSLRPAPRHLTEFYLWMSLGGVIGGMFHFVWKNEFREADRVRVWLYLVTATIEQGRVIQQCVSQMEQAAAESVDALARQLRGLSVDDFGYMQQLSLEKEGDPISEYVVSCLAAFFVQQFRARALTDRQAVDELLFDQLAFGGESPSAEFVKLFMGIVSQPVGVLTRHPRADPSVFTKEDELPTNVHFGDVFLRGSAALMVATPECDLVSTPHQPTNRKFDPDQSVLLVPGAVEAYSKPWSKMPGRTEFVEIDSRPHSVTWDFKKVSAVRVGTLKRHLDDAGYERRLRLSPEFALDVQRMYFADVGRIGLPVGPPIYEPLEVTLCCQDVDGTVTTLLKTSDVEPHYAVSFVTRTERVFQLTGSFFLRLPGAIQEAISKLEQRAKLAAVDSKGRQKCGMRIAELKRVSLTASRLDSLRKPFRAMNPDAEQDCPVFNTVIRLSTKKIPEGSYVADRPLLLVIQPKQTPIPPPKASTGTADASPIKTSKSRSAGIDPEPAAKGIAARVKPADRVSEPATKRPAKVKARTKSASREQTRKKEPPRESRSRK